MCRGFKDLLNMKHIFDKLAQISHAPSSEKGRLKQLFHQVCQAPLDNSRVLVFFKMQINLNCDSLL